MPLLVKFILLSASFAAIMAAVFAVIKTRRSAPELVFESEAVLYDFAPEAETFDEVVQEPSITSEEALIAAEPIMEDSYIEPAQQEQIIVLHLFAKKDKLFVGYELLQAILAVGLRFGEMDIFHRYQSLSGSGPILFSLACATEPGTFEMQKMGGFSCTGLTLFLRLSNNSTIDSERFELLMETAEQLKEDLGGGLHDYEAKPLSAQKMQAYRQQILDQGEVVVAVNPQEDDQRTA
ncbi:MAG: cell division protein ZipA [Gammaproteobacteria bacterium]